MTSRRRAAAGLSEDARSPLLNDEAPKAGPSAEPWGRVSAGYPAPLKASRDAAEEAWQCHAADYPPESEAEFVSVFRAGCDTVAAELEAAAAHIGWAEALAAWRHCGASTVEARCRDFRSLTSVRH